MRSHRIHRRLVRVGVIGGLVASIAAQSAAAGTEPAANRGDLSHLVYTARTGLVAHALSPDDGGIVNSVATSFEVATVSGAGVELVVNANVVPLKKLGRRAELSDGSVRYTYYGVVLAPGPNVVALTPLGADGLRGPTVTERVWGPGAARTIRLTGCPAPRADGRTPCIVRAAVNDAWGHPAAPGATLKAAVTDGDAAILSTGVTGGDLVGDELTAAPTASRRTRSFVLLPGSNLAFAVVPGTLPGRIRISAAVGDVAGSTQFDAMAFARPPFVTGVATVGVGAVPGDIGADPTIAQGSNSRLGRVALYGTGKLTGNAVGSLAYDTAGSLAATPQTGTLNDDPNARPYATYGDSSIRRNDALTQDRLYARVDDGYSNAMWGQFEATTGPPGTAGSASLQVDGAKLGAGSATTTVSAFSAANHVGYGREILDPTGLATLEPLRNDNLIVGSETVTLVSRDRRTGVIVKQTTLQNVLDYTIDYVGGIIRFIDIPLPFDAAFNPQQVLVTYQYSVTTGSASTTGARLQIPVGHFDGITFGMGYLNDETGTANFSLRAANLGGTLPGGSWSASQAQSTGYLPGATEGTGGDGGSALRVAGSGVKGPYTFSFGYDATSTSYGNPFGDLQTPGLSDYHASLLRALGSGRKTDIGFTYDHEATASLISGTGVATQSNLAAVLHEKLGSRITVHVGFTFHSSDAASSATPASTPARSTGPASVSQADLGVDWRATRNLALGLERDQTVGGFDPTRPAQTTAEASWELGDRGRIFARELLSDAPAQSFDSVAGVASRAFELGIEQKVDLNTSVESDYALTGIGNSTDVHAAIGVKEHLLVSRLLKADAFVQRGAGGGATTTPFAVYGLTLAYGGATSPLLITGSLQDRTGSEGGATWSFGAAGKLTPDLSLIAADQGSHTAGSATTDARVAIAWRPSRSDRGALFAGYERSAGNADVAGVQSGVASLDGVYRLTGRLQITGRYARKTDGDGNYIAGTSLVGLGFRERLGSRFDIGLETRAVLVEAAAAGLHSTAVEFGSMVSTTLRAGMGYNFGATADPVLAAAPARRGIYATLTTTIDRIFGWGAH